MNRDMMPPADHDVMAAQAEAWLFRLRAEDASHQDREAFSRWLDQHPDHRRVWEETLVLFDATMLPARMVAASGRGRSVRNWRWGGRIGIVARAAVVGLAVAVVAMVMAGRWADWGADVATGHGERRTITLRDGSVADLNGETALDLDVDGMTRRVRLRRGEAFFSIARDPAHPFVVTTDHGDIRVVGTRFSVRDDGVKTVVAVEEGVVEVSPAGTSASSVHVSRAQQVMTDGRTLSDPVGLDSATAFAWRRGQIVFRQQRLGDLVAQMDHYWSGRVLVLDPALADRRVSGVIDTDRRDDSLRALQDLLGVRLVTLTPYLAILY